MADMSGVLQVSISSVPSIIITRLHGQHQLWWLYSQLSSRYILGRKVSYSNRGIMPAKLFITMQINSSSSSLGRWKIPGILLNVPTNSFCNFKNNVFLVYFSQVIIMFIKKSIYFGHMFHTLDWPPSQIWVFVRREEFSVIHCWTVNPIWCAECAAALLWCCDGDNFFLFIWPLLSLLTSLTLLLTKLH